jgi:hypothetical protein
MPICGRDWSPADYPENETTSHKIDAEPKIPRGGTDLITPVHSPFHPNLFTAQAEEAARR